VWLTEISEHAAGEGKLYLCAVKDVFSNRIVGYSIASRMKASLEVSALNHAITLRSPTATPVIDTHDVAGEKIRPLILRRIHAAQLRAHTKPALGNATEGERCEAIMGERLFVGLRGGRIQTGVLRAVTHWNEVVTKLGYEQRRRHDLRHTGLTRVANAVCQPRPRRRLRTPATNPRITEGRAATMTSKLAGTVALVTGASSGIGQATARRLAADGAAVVLVARRLDRLQTLATEIEQSGGTAMAVQADITDRAQAEAAVQQGLERFARLDILVNNAGVMLLGPVVGADPDEWDRMIALNAQGLLYTTHAALPNLLKAAEADTRRVADIVNISSVAGRSAGKGFGVYNLTKFGVNGFTESLRQELTERHVRVGVVEPGAVASELGSHNSPEVRAEMIDPYFDRTEVLAPRTSPTPSPTWSPDHATPPSANSGSCPPNSPDPTRPAERGPGLESLPSQQPEVIGLRELPGVTFHADVPGPGPPPMAQHL
jgi:NADP-dependent 3-hydroxy acid dehydrogenase YdfG